MLTQLAAFGNIAQTVEVHVGTRKDMRQTLAADVVLRDVFLHPRQRQRAGRFRYRTHIFEQIFHCGANGVAVDGDNIVEILLAKTEGFIANAFNRHAFSKQPDAW